MFRLRHELSGDFHATQFAGPWSSKNVIIADATSCPDTLIDIVTFGIPSTRFITWFFFWNDDRAGCCTPLVLIATTLTGQPSLSPNVFFFTINVFSLVQFPEPFIVTIFAIFNFIVNFAQLSHSLFVKDTLGLIRRPPCIHCFPVRSSSPVLPFSSPAVFATLHRYRPAARRQETACAPCRHPR